MGNKYLENQKKAYICVWREVVENREKGSRKKL